MIKISLNFLMLLLLARNKIPGIFLTAKTFAGHKVKSWKLSLMIPPLLFRELPFSEELDSFSIGSKRASRMFPSNGSNGKNSVSGLSYDNNGIDMYGD